MSVMKTAPINCPSCGQENNHLVTFSINVDRRPDIRKSILERTYQVFECPSCSVPFRLEPEFTYLDIERKQYIQVHPLSSLSAWKMVESNANELLRIAFGQGLMKSIGTNICSRLVFGWAALNEKLICQENEIDDVDLELVKMAIIRTSSSIQFSDTIELRLIEFIDGVLRFAWLDALKETPFEILEVAGGLLDEVQDTAWTPLREEVSAGLFVDVNRLLVVGEEIV